MSTIITKNELVKEVVANMKEAEMKVTKKDAEQILEIILETISTHFEKGQGVRLPGFVTFEIAEVAERKARNPQTGDEIVVPAHNKLKTKVSKALKDRIH